MYQSPDFVKVDLDIKDNFSSYANPCIVIVGSSYIEGYCDNPTDPSYGFKRYTEFFSNPRDCYNDINY